MGDASFSVIYDLDSTPQQARMSRPTYSSMNLRALRFAFRVQRSIYASMETPLIVHNLSSTKTSAQQFDWNPKDNEIVTFAVFVDENGSNDDAKANEKYDGSPDDESTTKAHQEMKIKQAIETFESFFWAKYDR